MPELPRRRLGFGLLLLALAGGCDPQPRPQNAIFVVVDTLRADHLGCYGYARATSPHVDALAAEGVRFERAYATAPWTKPSVASMITGLHPSALGIETIFSKLPAEVDTLAEMLRDAGYRTAGAVSHLMLSNQIEMGFGQGYDVYLESEARGHDHVSTDGIAAQALRLLRELADDGRPFLLFVHFFDPHFDYLDVPEIEFAAPRGALLSGGESIIELRARIGELGEQDFGFLRDRYDEEIRRTDAGIGRVLAALRELSLEDETLVVLAGDHGEEFGERGWIGHTPSLHEEVIRVPLLLRAPGLAPRVVGEPVSLVSLTPTILELLGIELAGRSLQGRSIAGLVRGEATRQPKPVFSEIRFPLQDARIWPRPLDARALVGRRFKLIADDAAGTLRLYDLQADPGERVDLAPERPELTAELLARLRDWQRSASRPGPRASDVELSERDLELLRDLGYATE